MQETMTQTKFARHLKRSPSYVTALKQAGRLVMRGNRVEVKASVAKIAETADPNRVDVQQRHAEERERKNGGEVKPKKHTGNFSFWRTEKMRLDAAMAQRELDKLSGKLVEAEVVEKAGAEIGTAFRGAIENLCDQLAPMLAPVTDENKVRAILVDESERILSDLATKLADMVSVKVSAE